MSRYLQRVYLLDAKDVRAAQRAERVLNESKRFEYAVLDVLTEQRASLAPCHSEAVTHAGFRFMRDFMRPLLVLVAFAVLVVAVMIYALTPRAKGRSKKSKLACAQPYVDSQLAREAEWQREEDERKKQPQAPASSPVEPEPKKVSWGERMDRFDRMNPLELLARAPEDDLMYLVDRRISKKPVEHCTPEERNVYWLGVLKAQVGNGGFDQYFFNSSGDHALEARAALAAIGPREALDVYDCALSAFPDAAPSEDRDDRYRQLQRIGDDAFDGCDSEFWHLRDAIERAGAAYVRANATAFLRPPPVSKDPLTWPRARADTFGCFMERELGVRDKRFTCTLKSYQSFGDPCANAERYYEGPKFPKRAVAQIGKDIADIALAWEHGELQSLTITYAREMSDKEIDDALKLDRPAPPNIQRFDIQKCGKNATCVLFDGFEHMGGGDLGCK